MPFYWMNQRLKVEDFLNRSFSTLTKRVRETLTSAKIKNIHDLPPSIRRFQGQQWLQRHVLLNYKAVDVVGDGSCWYRAVSMCLFATEKILPYCAIWRSCSSSKILGWLLCSLIKYFRITSSSIVLLYSNIKSFSQH